MLKIAKKSLVNASVRFIAKPNVRFASWYVMNRLYATFFLIFSATYCTLDPTQGVYMKISKRSAILISFALWFAVGMMLLYKGLGYLYESIALQMIARKEQPILGFLSHLTGSIEYAFISIIFVSIAFGYIKSYYALRKGADRILDRIRSFSGLIPLAELYPPAYGGLILGMMMLGMGLKYVPITSDIRGIIDTAIGFALLSGSTFYLRALLPSQKRAR